MNRNTLWVANSVPSNLTHKIKELNELKDKFTHKIDFHKTELKKISGDAEFNKIYQAYQTDEVYYPYIL